MYEKYVRSVSISSMYAVKYFVSASENPANAVGPQSGLQQLLRGTRPNVAGPGGSDHRFDKNA